MKSNDNLKNIFLMPCGSAKSRQHLNQTVLQPVSQSTIYQAIPELAGSEFETIFGEDDVAVWGSVNGSGNRSYFNKMKPCDYIVFTANRQVLAVGQIAFKTESSELSNVLWSNDGGRVFSLVYFLANVMPVNTPLSKVFAALGYSENYRLQGLTSVSSNRLKPFYEKHPDLFSLVADSEK